MNPLLIGITANLMRNKRGYFKELAKEKKKREFSLK
jgi:hypothetical protein